MRSFSAAVLLPLSFMYSYLHQIPYCQQSVLAFQFPVPIVPSSKASSSSSLSLGPYSSLCSSSAATTATGRQLGAVLVDVNAGRGRREQGSKRPKLSIRFAVLRASASHGDREGGINGGESYAGWNRFGRLRLRSIYPSLSYLGHSIRGSVSSGSSSNSLDNSDGKPPRFPPSSFSLWWSRGNQDDGDNRNNGDDNGNHDDGNNGDDDVSSNHHHALLAASSSMYYGGTRRTRGGYNTGRSVYRRPHITRRSFTDNKPTVTQALLIINVLIFILQMRFPAVTAFGAKNNFFIFRKGQTHRLFSPIFLHTNLVHLLVNSSSLNALGPSVETIFGKKRMLSIYFFSGMCGCLASCMMAPSTVSVGASGALFGLVGALGTLFSTNPQAFGDGGKRNLESLGRTVALNLVLGMSSGIDNWSHIGGLLGGALMTFFVGPRYVRVFNPITGTYVLEDKPLVSLRYLTGSEGSGKRRR